MSLPTPQDAAEGLRRLLSNERGLDILSQVVSRHTELWQEIEVLLSRPHRYTHRSRRRKRGRRTSGADAATRAHMTVARTVLQGILEPLQLRSVPNELLGLVVDFLSIKDNVSLLTTSRFFRDAIPALVKNVYLQHAHALLHRFFAKCERLRFLTVDPDQPCELLFPWRCLSTLRHVSLIDTFFRPEQVASADSAAVVKAGSGCGAPGGSKTKAAPKSKKGKDKTATIEGPRPQSDRPLLERLGLQRLPLEMLVLSGCANMNVDAWLQITSKRAARNLKSVTLGLHRCVEYLLADPTHSPELFASKLLQSPAHDHVQQLSLSTHQQPIIRALVEGQGCLRSLLKLELGLLDRQTPEDVPVAVAPLFLQLVQGRAFPNLEMLIVDFAPKNFAVGDDLTPLEFETFAKHIPATFPKLRLLAFYGGSTPLLFGDDHFRALLRTQLPQICDLSVGFELITPAVVDDFLSSNAFPNLVWLTLELLKAQEFRDDIRGKIEALRPEQMSLLEWVTICVCEEEKIFDMQNGISFETWGRGVDECDFDEALRRSDLIARRKKPRRTRGHATAAAAGSKAPAQAPPTTSNGQDCILPLG